MTKEPKLYVCPHCGEPEDVYMADQNGQVAAQDSDTIGTALLKRFERGASWPAVRERESGGKRPRISPVPTA